MRGGYFVEPYDYLYITFVVGIAAIPFLYWFFGRNWDQEQSEERGPDRGKETTTKMPKPSQGNRSR